MCICDSGAVIKNVLYPELHVVCWLLQFSSLFQEIDKMVKT